MYKSHLEHMDDIQKLMDLKLEAYKSGFEKERVNAVRAMISNSKAKASKSQIFLPVAHIVKVFMLNPVEEHFLHTFYLYENSSKYKTALNELFEQTEMAFDVILSLFCSAENENYSGFINGLLDKEDGKYSLKSPITAFIALNGGLIEKPWFEYYYSTKSEYIFDSETLSDVSEIIALCVNDVDNIPKVINVTGKSGCGRSSLIRAAAAEKGLPILFIDCKILKFDDVKKAADEIVTESILTEGAICLLDFDSISDEAEKLAPLLWRIRRSCRFMFVTAITQWRHFWDWKLAAIEYKAPDLSAANAAKLWRAELGGTFDFEEVTRVYRLTPTQIKSAVNIIRRAEKSRQISGAYILNVCREVAIKEADGLGKVVIPEYKWDDVILPKLQKDDLFSAIMRVRNKDKVFDNWGFSKVQPYGRGTRILLHGPPGTGKTMTALAFAHELGLAAYKIDLSAVVSKYIGETEKNLENVFKSAQNANCLLFFDEADALFGKRTEIKDSHDRHANMQASFLLQKIEDYSGIVILATNMLRNFDDAFKRRFQFIINIPLPSKELREIIWKKSFPLEMPISEDIDFDYLSDFAVNGSTIKNAALFAAFYAAQAEKPVCMQYVINALKKEMEKIGTVAAGEFDY